MDVDVVIGHLLLGLVEEGPVEEGDADGRAVGGDGDGPGKVHHPL